MGNSVIPLLQSVLSGGGKTKIKYIATASDFPTKLEADAYVWDFYVFTANVTDNDPTKTNTNQSFLAGEEAVWNLTNYTVFGASALWGDDLTDLLPINPRNINIALGKIYKINNENIFTRNNPELNTFDKAVFGAINENFDKLEITNGHILETISLIVTSSGTVITASLSAAIGTDLHFVFSNGIQTVDVTTPITAILTAGSDTSPQENWLYVLKSNPAVLVVNTTDFPSDSTTEYAPVGRIIVQSATTVLADGVLKQHNYTDHIKAAGGIGHLHDVNEWIREQWATWIDGVAQTVTGGGTATVTYAVSSGRVRQLHLQAFPAFIDPATLYVINDSVAPYTKVNNIGGGILLDSLGGTLNNRYYNLVVWGVCSKEGLGESKLFINLPSGSYATQPSAESDSARLTNYGIPSKYKGTGFLIQRILFRNNASTTYTLVDTEDLRGQFPNAAAGTSVSVGAQFPDNVFEVFNNADNTKVVDLDASNITTGNTRTITIPDRDLDLANPDFDTVNTDIIKELTGGNGVDVDGVLHKDGSATLDFFPAQLYFGTAASAPAGWYHLNSSAGTNVIDSSGFGINLTTVNMVDGDWVPGLLNNCLQFAATKYAQASSQTDLSFDNTDAFSFECWVNNSDVTAQIVLSKMSQIAPNRGYQIVQNATTGKLNFSLRNDVATNQISVDGNIGIADGTWNHVVVTYDGSSDASGVKIYVNSILNTNTVLVNTLTATTITTTKFQLSGRDTTTLNYLGKIDEVVIYPRVIDQTFITQRYNSGIGTEVIPGFLNRGSLNVNSITGKMTQLYGGDFELICSAGGSKILFTPPSDGGVEITDGVFSLKNGTTIDEFSIDGALIGNSDDALPTEKAVKTYVDNAVLVENLWDRLQVRASPSVNVVLPHTATDAIALNGFLANLPTIPSTIKYFNGLFDAGSSVPVNRTYLYSPNTTYPDYSWSGAINNGSSVSIYATLNNTGYNIASRLFTGGELNLAKNGIVKANTDYITITNTISGFPDNNGTENSALFRQERLDGTPINQGRITFGTENDWINDSNQNAYFDFYLTRNGSLLKAYSIISDPIYTSDSIFNIEGNLQVNTNSASPVHISNGHIVDRIFMTSGTTIFSINTSCNINQNVSITSAPAWDKISLNSVTPTNGLTISLASPLATYETGMGISDFNKFVCNKDSGGTFIRNAIYSSDDIMLMLDSNNTSIDRAFRIKMNSSSYESGVELFYMSEQGWAVLKGPAAISNSTAFFTIDTTDIDDQSMLQLAKGGVVQWKMASRNQLDTPADRLSIYSTTAEALTILQGGNVGINVNNPNGSMLHIAQSSSTAGIPVLKLDQTDISEGFFDLIGSDRLVINTSTTNSVASARVELNGIVYTMPLFADQ